ncbi:MAG: SIS domain-containing protein [Bowdeniella nasicola]|nr:SIS domain-containing protein [Bowdeniella nasicola]
MSITVQEIASQPEMWRRAGEVARARADVMPREGQSVAVLGCGTSWFIAQSYCSARETAGQGRSDAFTATEFPAARNYDVVIFLSRSGTTTEIVDLAKNLAGRVRTILLTAVGGGPAAEFVDAEVVLDFADEESVVQTRFATSALAFFRASIGVDLDPVIADARTMLDADIPAEWVSADQVTFLGAGWTNGLAYEAALKLREASQSWTEAYPAMEYRHGPISIAEEGRLTWMFGTAPAGLEAQVRDTGATFVTSTVDPMAHLVLAQRLAIARAQDRGLNPDTPRHLTRSVILDEA